MFRITLEFAEERAQDYHQATRILTKMIQDNTRPSGMLGMAILVDSLKNANKVTAECDKIEIKAADCSLRL